MADLDLLDDERRAKLLERTANAKPLSADGLWRRALNGVAISAGTLRRIVLLEDRLARALAILRSGVDDEPCRLDHHGYCQAHDLSNPCNMVLIRELLAESGPAGGGSC